MSNSVLFLPTLPNAFQLFWVFSNNFLLRWSSGVISRCELWRLQRFRERSKFGRHLRLVRVIFNHHDTETSTLHFDTCVKVESLLGVSGTLVIFRLLFRIRLAKRFSTRYLKQYPV